MSTLARPYEPDQPDPPLSRPCDPGGQPDPPLFASQRVQPAPTRPHTLGWRVQPDSTRQPESKNFTFFHQFSIADFFLFFFVVVFLSIFPNEEK
jgi:hypothetical protein